MPWQEVTPMEQRLDFIRDYETELFTMTELAAQYGISRKTGYKWLERYAAEGAVGLQDRSRRPHASPQATDADLVAALIAVRKRHPRWGAKKLLAVAARRDPDAAWPSRSTVCDLLTAHDLVVPGRRARPPAINASAQQRRFARFCLEYNEVRPHEALRDQPPASQYKHSQRTMPRRLPPPAYAPHLEVRRVSSNGCVSWRNGALFIASAL